MSRLPVISGDDFARAVRGIGYVLDRTEGSHMILRRADGRSLSVPRRCELGRGLLRALIRDVGLTRREFMELLR